MTTKTMPETTPILKIERVFNATPEKLWSYWTDPAKYARWLNPAPIDLVIHEFDVRPGGRVRFDMPQPDGNKNPQEGVFHSLTPYTEIVTGSPDKSFLLTVRFEPLAHKTRMTVLATGVPAQFHQMATQGWNAGLDKLAREIEGAPPQPVRRTYAPLITIDRTFKAPVEKVWKMWTTKEGLEQWYWPEPFVPKVLHLDLRLGGGFEIAAAGLAHTARGTFTEIEPNKRLGVVVPIEFIPNVEPYERIDSVEFHSVPGGTRMIFTSTQYHNAEWKQLATVGWNSSLDKLDRALEGKPATAKGFTIERTFQAPPEKVWAMWTTKAGLERWFVSDEYATTVRELDVRMGGKFAIELTSKDHTLVNRGTYTLVQPHWELGWTWHFDIFLVPGEKPYDVPIFVAFEKTPTGGTKMTFTQGPLATPEFTEGSRQGVMSNFDRLAKALEA